ncbi:MAG: DUF4430 domain-containing protein [Peptococcaceae bacterium]|nr:DUF4430 domain-containing protein [Peptococcaceae bacterium]
MKQMMKNKKAIAVLLLVAMLFSIMPTAVFAEENSSSASPITAYVTIVKDGKFVTGKDSITVAHLALKVTDENKNGFIDIDDVLYAAHEAYYPDDVEDGYTSEEGQWGLSITKLWGDTSGSFGYCVNNASASSLADQVKNGDHVVAYVYKDQTEWSDVYSYFDKHQITTNSALTLSLLMSDYDENYNPITKPIKGATITVDGVSKEDITDKDGKVILSFTENRTYMISATTESMILVPPICVVTFDENYVPDNNDNEGDQGNSGKDEAIISAVTVDDIPELLENIAATYMNSSNDKWKIWGMTQYALLNSDTEFKLTDKAKQEYLNLVVDAITANNPTETDYNNAVVTLTALGIDPTKIYPVNSNTPIDAVKELKTLGEFSADAWSASYTLAALNQSYKYKDSNIEKQLITKILASQNKDGWWSDSWGGKTQATAHMLIGLSYYQDINDEVKKAVDKAVEYLKSIQEENGSFSDGYGAEANTTAIVILGLSSVGINPNEVKTEQGYSAIDGLLSFALNNKTGFDYSDHKIFNDFATKQAYLALIAAYQVQDNVEAFNVYDFSGNELVPGRATGAGVVVGPSSPSEDNDNITVKMSIRADNGYWMRNQSVTVKEGSTVYQALVKGLEKYGMEQEGAESGYVEEITYNGRTLAEFDLGPNSGWLYTVNGELPEVGLLDCVLQNGDNILWYYTED